MESKFEESVIGVLGRLGIKEINPGATTGLTWIDTKGDVTESVSPIDGEVIAKVSNATTGDYELVMKKAGEAFAVWKSVPAPLLRED